MGERYYPYSVNIELTLACNMRCLHCGSTAGKARRGELTREEYSRLFRGLAGLGCSEVCLLGGEPFLRKDWHAVAGDAADAGLKLIFITNGLRVKADVVRKLRRLGAVDRVGVSIDGPTADIHEHIRGRAGTFDKAWTTARLFRDSGFETGIITTVSRINVASLEAMKDLVVGQNLTWQIQTAAPQGRRFDRKYILSPQEFYEVGRLVSFWRNTIPVEDLPVCGSHDFGYFSKILTRYGELPDWNGCGAGLYTLGIMSDGRVKGCLCQHDDFVEANVRERGVDEIWNDERLFARNRRFRVELLEGDCRGCRHGSVCRAGCSNLSYTMTGSTYNNPYCFHRMERHGLVKRGGRRSSRRRSCKTGPPGFRGRKVP